MDKQETIKHAMTFGFGGMNATELSFLYDFCKDKNVLELGSHVGQSSYVISATAKHVCCVDAWQDDTPFLEEKQAVEYRKQPKGMLQQFIDNVRNVRENVWMVQGFTQDSVDKTRDDYDIVLIDADHSYEGVKRDIELYRNKAPIIIFHDYNTPSWEGVKRAVDESGLKITGICEFLCITEKED